MQTDKQTFLLCNSQYSFFPKPGFWKLLSSLFFLFCVFGFIALPACPPLSLFLNVFWHVLCTITEFIPVLSGVTCVYLGVGWLRQPSACCRQPELRTVCICGVSAPSHYTLSCVCLCTDSVVSHHEFKVCPLGKLQTALKLFMCWRVKAKVAEELHLVTD